MNLLEMLFGAMSTQSSVDTLSQQTGSSKSQISKLIALALPILIRQMTKNASSQQGAQSLAGALSQHTGDASLESQILNADKEDGAKILQHILGGNFSSIMGDLSQQTGMDQPQVESVMDSLAPALLNGLSQATSQQAAQPSSGLDLGSLASLFGVGKPQGGDAGDLLSSLLGSEKEDQSAVDGSSLLQTLMSFM